MPILLTGAGVGNGSGSFSPDSITGLRLWLDASSSPVWQDAAGTVAAVADSDPVRRWDDLSGNGRNVTAPSDAARPTLKLAQQNGKPALRFDGVDDCLRALFASPKPTTIYAVLKPRAWQSWGYFFDSATEFNQLMVRQYPENPMTTVYNGTYLLLSTVTVGNYHILTASYLTDATSLRRNADTPVSGGAIPYDGADGLTIANIGYYYASTYNNLCSAIDVAEVLVYGAALSVAEDAAVIAYLNAKWSIY